MKIKLPFVLRKTHERVTGELVKDIKVKEAIECAADKKIENLKLQLEERDKQIKGMEWCIQERDKELDKVKEFNMKLYKKVELSGEMQRQVKEKIDIAFNIDVIEKERTEHGAIRTITTHDIKKLLKGEDLVEIYTKIALMV